MTISVLVVVAVTLASLLIWQQVGTGDVAATPPHRHSSATQQQSPTSESSPVAAGQPTESAQPAPAATTASHPATIVMPITPTALAVPELSSHKIRVVPKPISLQYNPHLGKTVPMYGVPDDLATVTWWSADHHGVAAPKPGGPLGNPNIALFFGHTGIDGAHGVFDHLGRLRLGQRFFLEGFNASGKYVRMTLEVVRVHSGIDKADPNALNNSIAKAPAATRASFFTCSGSVDEAISSSNFNTEVDTTIVSVQVVGK